VFAENLFPFSNFPGSSTSPSVSPSVPMLLVDSAYAPVLFSCFGTGTIRGVRLELLEDAAPSANSPSAAPHVDPAMHGADTVHAPEHAPLRPLSPPVSSECWAGPLICAWFIAWALCCPVATRLLSVTASEHRSGSCDHHHA
jgi:hypothetical protein